MKWNGIRLILLLATILMQEIQPASSKEQKTSRRKLEKRGQESSSSSSTRGIWLDREQALFLRRLLAMSKTTPKSRKFHKSEDSSHRDYERFRDRNHGKNWRRRSPPFINRTESKKRNDEMMFENSSSPCCPQKFELIQPVYGRNRTGHLVKLYKDEKIQQRFYELICNPEILEKPCRFLQGRNHKLSRCTQQHVFTYALVQSSQSAAEWSLDHIRIRSGCICKLHHISGESARHVEDLDWKLE